MILNKKNIKLGIAPIGWTNDDLPQLGQDNTFEQCISEMALAGFEGCEVGNKYPRSPHVLKQKLKLRGLTIVNAWYSTFFTTNNKQATIQGFIKHRDFLHQMGAKIIGVSEQGYSIQGARDKNIFQDKPVFTNEQWALLVEGLEELARLCEAKGMKLAYHHHMGTGVQTEAEIDQLMQKVSKKVYLLIDTGHLYWATESQEALERIASKYMARTAHIHLKDVRIKVMEAEKTKGSSFLDAICQGIYTVPGDGIIDYEPFFKIVQTNNYQGWMIVEAEQDPAIANPLEYAIKARKFIRKTTGL